METALIGIILGIVAGILSGMFGIGGGVVIVPALIVIAGFSLTMANGTSLAALLLPVGLFACIQYYRAGYLNIKTAGFIAFGLLTGVYFGAELALFMDSEILKRLYGGFLLYVSWLFIAPLELLKLRKPKPSWVDESDETKVHPFFLYLLGIATGIMSGLFGIGGGLIITPFLMVVLKFNPKKAIGTSLGALLLPVGLPGILVYYAKGSLDVEYAAFIALGMVFGAILGAKITIKLSSRHIKRIYGFFMLLMALDFIFRGMIAAMA